MLDLSNAPESGATDPTAGASVIGLLKRLRTLLQSTLKVNPGGLAVGQTLKTYVARITAGAGITTLALWTVTAGKTLYVTDIFIDSDGAAMKDIRLQAAAVDIWRQQVRDLVPCRSPAIETQPQAAAAQAVTLVIPIGAENYDIVVLGYEQ
jgi:hypothetical protein